MRINGVGPISHERRRILRYCVRLFVVVMSWVPIGRARGQDSATLAHAIERGDRFDVATGAEPRPTTNALAVNRLAHSPVVKALWICLCAFIGSACMGSPADLGDDLGPGADSCALVRPSFGATASEADRSLFAYDVNAPLNLQKTLQSTNNGVEVSTISFTSPDGGLATGLLFDPVTRSSLRPGVVLMHGLPGNAGSVVGEANLLANYGAVVIAIDAPFARRSGETIRLTNQDRVEQIQLIKDLQRAVDVLRARPNVDDDRIAYVGFSYGGAMGALFAGIEHRIKAAALVVADGGLVSHLTGPDDSNLMASLSCATRVIWFKAMVPIEPIRFIPNASPTALLLQSGRLDALVPVADAEDIHAAAPQPRTIRWYEAGHGLNQQAVLDRLDWLHDEIGLDPRQ